MKPPEVLVVLGVAPGGWHIRKKEEKRTMEVEDTIVTRKVGIMECGEVIGPTATQSQMFTKPSKHDSYCPDCNAITICEW
jgi:hypothetical protein